MNYDKEIHDFLLKHIKAIRKNDVKGYHRSTSSDLTLYEWWITPQRIDGLPFHDFMMQENAERGQVFGSEVSGSIDEKPNTRFDLANLHIQRYGDTAIASYTLLTSTGTDEGVKVVSHNESRVIVKVDGNFQVVHVHKSPSWQAPHMPNEG